MTILFVSFPDNFEERYLAYKAKLLDNAQQIPYTENAQITPLPSVNVVGKKDVLNNEPYTEIDEENKIGFLCVNGKRIEIGMIDNVPFKMLKAFCPFGKPIAITKAVDMTTPDRLKKISKLSPLDGPKLLESRIKDLRNLLRKKNIKLKIYLDFNNDEGTVSMKKTS